VLPKPAKSAAKPRKPQDPNAPKRPRGRPRKDGTIPHAKQDDQVAAAASESDSDSDSLEGEEMPPPILDSPPPVDMEGRAVYDTVKAVWSPREKIPIPDKLRNGIALFGETIRKLRDAWKVQNESLKQAELGNSATVPALKAEVARYRDLVENITTKALEIGHPLHLQKYVFSLPSPCMLMNTCPFAIPTRQAGPNISHCRPTQGIGRMIAHVNA